MAVTPAGAEVSNAVATNWKKIWKKNLKPLADKRYYTKAQSDAKYPAKAESSRRLGGCRQGREPTRPRDTQARRLLHEGRGDAKYAPYPS